MDRYTDSFNDHSEAMRERRKAEDFDNLQHTLSGVETGQQTRHGLKNDAEGSVTGRGKRKSVEEQLLRTLEWLLLNDPVYGRLHEQTMVTLQQAEQFGQTALQRILAALEREQVILEELLASAARLPDGTIVFLDQNGQFRDRHGSIIDDDITATIQWRGNEPSYEDYVAQQNKVQELTEAENELRGVETELGDIRGELTDNEKPPTSDRIESLKDQIEQLQIRSESLSQNFISSKLDSKTEDSVSLRTVTSAKIPSMPPKQ